MRISDWSSDVCSSDLHRRQHLFQSEQDLALGEIDAQAAMNAESERHVRRIAVEPDLVGMLILLGIATGERNGQEHAITGLQLYARHLNRSAEHTSELQSLMPLPYAVFCLKKKN